MDFEEKKERERERERGYKSSIRDLFKCWGMIIVVVRWLYT
jgi:hypothetical protein